MTAIKSRELIPLWASHVLEDFCDLHYSKSCIVSRPKPTIECKHVGGSWDDADPGADAVKVRFRLDYNSTTACPIVGAWFFDVSVKDYMLSGFDACTTPCGQTYEFGDDDPIEGMCRHDRDRIESLLRKAAGAR